MGGVCSALTAPPRPGLVLPEAVPQRVLSRQTRAGGECRTFLQAGSHDIESLRGTEARHEKGHDTQGFSVASEAVPKSMMEPWSLSAGFRASQAGVCHSRPWITSSLTFLRPGTHPTLPRVVPGILGKPQFGNGRNGEDLLLRNS